MKVERFIKEYASCRKKTILSNDLIQERFKTKAITQIDGAVKAKERGLITTDEAISLILNCFGEGGYENEN